MLAFALMIVFYGTLVYDNSSFSHAEEMPPQNTIYLTFDDGPSDRVTPKILDVLAEENVKATFFIIGRQAVLRKPIIEREFNEGHTVAVHSYSHEYGKIYASPQSLLEDIDKCNKVIKEITGKYSYVYRFPGGSFTVPNETITAVTTHGLRYVDWNASTRDAEIYDATCEQIFNSATTTAAYPENIVLLAHDSTNKLSTAAALKDIIRYYKERNYVFCAF